MNTAVSILKGTLTEYQPLHITTPDLTTPALLLSNLMLFSRVAFGAFSGFDEAAILAGECRNPTRTISQSLLIVTPVIAIFYILVTSSVIAFVPAHDVDLIGTIQQVLAVALEPFGIAGLFVPIASLALLLMVIATVGVVFTQNARLPMTAGWDDLLPQWFSKLHSEYKTPVNSIIFTGAVAIMLGLGGLIGVSYQEAFQLLLNISFVLWALTYLIMFALPLIGLKGSIPRPSFWLKIASGSGFLITFLYVVLSIIPNVEVSSRFEFAVKIVGVIVAVNIFGIYIFLIAKRKQKGKNSKATSSNRKNNR